MPDQPVMTEGLSTAEASVWLGCNPQTLSRAQNGKNLRYPQAATRVGNRYRFAVSDVAAFLRGEK